MKPGQGERGRLLHIQDSIRQIIAYTAAGDQVFFSDRLIQDGVIRNLEIIGEAVKQLSPQTREKAPEIPWKEIAGMRDFLIHVYFGVDLTTVWDVVQGRLPALQMRVNALLAESDGLA